MPQVSSRSLVIRDPVVKDCLGSFVSGFRWQRGSPTKELGDDRVRELRDKPHVAFKPNRNRVEKSSSRPRGRI